MSIFSSFHLACIRFLYNLTWYLRFNHVKRLYVFFVLLIHRHIIVDVASLWNSIWCSNIFQRCLPTDLINYNSLEIVRSISCSSVLDDFVDCRFHARESTFLSFLFPKNRRKRELNKELRKNTSTRWCTNEHAHCEEVAFESMFTRKWIAFSWSGR